MAKLRGDDDLFAVLEDLSSAQGYESKDQHAEKEPNQEPARPAKRKRLSSDIPEYPSNKPAGNQAIWNPYVQIDVQPCPTRCLAPTNPQVEVFRRRAYERFKDRIKQIFERATANSTKQGPGNLWRELQVVSLIERWHFAAKLAETQMLHRTQPLEHLTTSLEWRTHQVHDFIEHASVEQRWVDPILISEPIARNRDKENKPKENILLEEIKFDWLRAWHRTCGIKGKDVNVETVFESKKFKSKSRSVIGGVKAMGFEIMANFRKELAKRAQDETLQSTRTRKNLPKLTHKEEDVSVTFSGLTFSINRQHFDKVVTLFDMQNQTFQSREEHDASFVSSLFCLLIRYDMLQGAGLQAALQGAVFDVLLRLYGCNLECFASPLNCRYERFFSAFPDTDAPFGSLGSFFDHDFLQGGCYQANPPFVARFIHAMYLKMEQSLSDCEEPLMFIVFIPAWNETSGWKALRESPHLQRYVLVDQSAHYYTEGTQHRRKASKRIASFNTSVFFLQNDAGKKKWIIDSSHVEELKLAFALDPLVAD
ncbi:Phosphorylated CTD interacting factor 1 WW domain [Fragilaria crotonensis]|nr:Phosphorylated CTD interacting factor 1 WW domain [Fragilaria crotonensis]